MIKSYVISLKRADIRRQHIISEFSAQNIGFEFFDAIEPEMNENILKRFGITPEQISGLNHYEVACLLSHVCIWDKIIKGNTEYAAVFEDDIYLGKNVSDILKNSEWIRGKELIKLEKFHSKVELSLRKCNIEFSNRYIHEILGKNLGTAGYVISKKGCKYMKKYLVGLKEIRPIDIIMFNQIECCKKIKVFQIEPAVVIQDSILNKENISFSSYIYHENENENNRKKDVKISEKFSREISRLYRSIRMRKVNFE